jgi:ADP-ribosylglycohydrolase
MCKNWIYIDNWKRITANVTAIFFYFCSIYVFLNITDGVTDDTTLLVYIVESLKRITANITIIDRVTDETRSSVYNRELKKITANITIIINTLIKLWMIF